MVAPIDNAESRLARRERGVVGKMTRDSVVEAALHQDAKEESQ
jgi:hypothetical protein